MTKEERIALKAVLYGCSTNRKIDGAMYFNRKTFENMDFSKACGIVSDMIEREEANEED